MNKNYTQVVATFEECGSTLISLGKYEAAKIQVKNGHTDDEVCVILEKSKTIKEPKFKQATKTTTLLKEFVDFALSKPRPPKGKMHWWLKSTEGKMSKRWASYSDDEKVKFRLEEMAEQEGWRLTDFELM